MIAFIKNYQVLILQNIILDYCKEKIIGEISIDMVKKIKKVAKALKKASALHKNKVKLLKNILRK